jgi:hypothetical protein
MIEYIISGNTSQTKYQKGNANRILWGIVYVILSFGI